MSPEYCGNCRALDLPCSKGLADAKGRRCPQADHACRTFEGEAVWAAVSRASGWSGGGMVPRRVDRQAVRARLSAIPGWILEDLIDAFEPAALAAMTKVEARNKQTTKTGGAARGARRRPSEDAET